jgi:hypothetical protein
MNVDNNKGGGGDHHLHVHFAPMAQMYRLDESCGDEQISNALWYSVGNFPMKLCLPACFFIALTDSFACC